MKTAWGRLAATARAAWCAGFHWMALGRADRSAYGWAWWSLLVCRLRLALPPGGAFSPAVPEAPVLSGRSAHEIGLGRLLALFRVAGRTHLFNPTCLHRSLALQRFLAHQGVASELRLGMRRGPQGLEGHAWVERQGVPLDDEKRVRSYVALEWTR